MKKRRWTSLFLGLLMLCVGGWAVLSMVGLSGCDGSIQRSPSVDWRVSNGAAFDVAAVDVSNVDTLVVPDAARVQIGSDIGRVHLYLKKILGYEGHPGSSVSIEGQRKKMGCAQRRDGRTMTLATYGSWDSHIEGGARIELLIVVPPGLKVGKRGGLSGEASAAEDRHTQISFWETPPLNAGWIPIDDRPDLQHRAGR
jgi:hypothetical protein